MQDPCCVHRWPGSKLTQVGCCLDLRVWESAFLWDPAMQSNIYSMCTQAAHHEYADCLRRQTDPAWHACIKGSSALQTKP